MNSRKIEPNGDNLFHRDSIITFYLRIVNLTDKEKGVVKGLMKKKKKTL